jgi:hypothetical protein
MTKIKTKIYIFFLFFLLIIFFFLILVGRAPPLPVSVSGRHNSESLHRANLSKNQ